MNYILFDSFKLSPEISQALTSLRYFKPTKVQEEVIPLALENQDIIVESQTGSGKTIAFGVPLCETVQWEENKPQALILVPTRELALQIKAEIMNVGRLKRIKVTAVFGKSSFKTPLIIKTIGSMIIINRIKRRLMVEMLFSKLFCLFVLSSVLLIFPK